MLERTGVERSVRLTEAHQVERCQVARCIIEEHVFRARVRRADRSRLGARVPVVDCGVELDAGISGRPGGVSDLLPQVARLDRLHDLVAQARRQIPGLVFVDRVEEVIRHAHRVVRVLTRDGEIGFAIPVGVVGVERDVGVTLLGKLDDAQNVVLRNLVALGFADRLLELGILCRIVAALVFGRVRCGSRRIRKGLAIDASFQHGLQMLLANLGAGDEGRNLLLLAHLPADVFLDVWMIDVDDDHLGRAPRGAARFDGAGRTVADLQERHQAGGTPTA